MLKGIFSFFAFIFLMLFISLFTMNAFLTSAVDNFDVVTTTFTEQSSVLVDQALEDFYSQLDAEQIASLNQLDALPVSDRQVILPPQCAQLSNADEQPYCDSRFIDGQFTISDVLKERAEEEFMIQQTEQLDQLKDKLLSYLKYPLLLLSIIAAILSLIFYPLAKGVLPGIRSFAGNAAWLSLLSALSFKFTPSLFDRLIGIQSAGQQVSTEAVSLLQEVIAAWLSPSLQHAFIVSLWLTIITFIIWLTLKIITKYDVEIEEV